MRPAVTVMQLDTRFPRLPGDVACPETYLDEVELLRIPAATVGQIVHHRPEQIDIAPFEAALARAKGEIIVTSCGFLSYWQNHLQSLTERPFIASSLSALQRLDPAETLVVTFDSESLAAAHFPGTPPDVVGLPKPAHLRRVIANDLPHIDALTAAAELADVVKQAQSPMHNAVLLECTNLPPHKPALRGITDLPIHDILTEIEALRSRTIRPEFL